VTLAPRKARLVEVFRSLQGEGRRVGERQVFVRFAVCDRKCRYCDTPESIGGAPPEVRVERSPGSGVFDPWPNPVAGEDLDRILTSLTGPGARPTISLTGGEPLLQAAFLAEWLPPRKERFRFVLETHGLLVEPLARVVEHLDEVVLDVKVPSATGEPTDWVAHADTVDLVREAGVERTLKAVVATGTTPDELERICELFARAGEDAGCILQPVSPHPGGPESPRPEELMAWQDRCEAAGLSVWVVPQVHRLMGLA
jgi:organic radical activating enzyme